MGLFKNAQKILVITNNHCVIVIRSTICYNKWFSNSTICLYTILNNKMKNIFKKFLVILISIFIAGILCEVFLRIFYDNFKNYNLEMWRYAVELKKPLSKTKLPFHHYSNSSGNYYDVDITTNSFGFRDSEISIEKNDSIDRILFIGDSFTLGWGVPFDSICSEVLEKKLNHSKINYEVINTGIGNYNSIMEVELFKLKGLELKPNIVILMFFVNDVEPIPKVSRLESSFIKNSYLFAFLFDKIQKINVLANEHNNWKNYYKKLYSNENIDALTQNKESLYELINICKQEHIDLIIVNIPELHEIKEYPLNISTKYIENIATEKNVRFIDLLDYLQDYKPESLWISQEDVHSNAKANYIFANVLYKKLLEW